MLLSSLLPIAAILIAAAVIVVVLRRLMNRHVQSAAAAPAKAEQPGARTVHEPATGVDEYLDSSHIIHRPSARPQDPPA